MRHLFFYFSSFEVPYFEDPTVAYMFSQWQTWGYHWQDSGAHGPEPYMMEYQFGFKLPLHLESIGFEQVEVVPYSFFEIIFLATKPHATI